LAHIPVGYNESMTEWKTDYQHEIDMALSARQRQNEGQARVCARRAAGIVIRAYYQQRGQTIRTPSAYDLLKLVMDDLILPESVRQSAAKLTLRVNEAFELPLELDLVKEAESIARFLFPHDFDRVDIS
jgi:HEPN domain-containing protein